ncbi:TOG domain-containing protein [Plasmodiophora brassicae]|nr:hypothetical protein PBRA_007514 [Plasmodiophora brassicae]
MQTTPAGECWKAPSRRQPRRSTGMGRRMEGVLCRDRYTETSEVMAMVSHDIDAECARVVADLQSTAWETKFTALGTLRRLAVHHHDQLHPYITSTMTGAILSSIASLRSSLARNALLAMTDLVSCCGSSFDRPALLSIIPELLRRATDSNEFLAVEAQKALDAIASLKHSTQALLDVRGRTQGEKAHIAACLLRCVNRRGCPSGSTPRLLKLACAFLEEGASDVRQVAKSLVCAIASRLTPAALCDTAAVVLTARQADLVRNVLAKASPSATHSKPQWDLTPQRVGTWTSYGEEQGGEQPVAIVLGPTVDANLASSEWRRRLQGLDGVLLAIRSVSLLTSGDVLLLTDRIGPRLSDANSKVTMCALDAFNCMVEGLPGPMSAAALTETLPSLCACMASSHANVRNLASSVVDTLMHRSHGPELLAQLARLASFGNIRVKAAAVAKLAVLVDLVVNKAAVRKHALPLAIALLDERKGDVYRANRQLLHALEACLDKQVWADEILALSADKAKKLHEMFVSSVP